MAEIQKKPLPNYRGPEIEDIINESGGAYGDSDISALFDAIANETGNSNYFHQVQTSEMEWLKELNKRVYNEGLRDEERAYNAPTAILGRLMATGMSRQAALQLLSSMSGGGSASAPYTQGAPQGTSQADNSQQFANYAAGANSIVQSIGGLMNAAAAGINVNNLARQGQLLKSQVFSSDLQTQAIKDVNEFVKALYSRDGARPNYDEISTAEGLVTWAQDPARENDNKPLFNFMRSPSARSLAGNVFAHSLLDDTFIKHTNARREEVANAALLRGRLLQYQTECASFDLKNAPIVLERNQIEFEQFKNITPIEFELKKRDLQYQLELFKQTHDPEMLKLVASKYRDDAFLQAFSASLKRQVQEYVTNQYNYTPEWESAINMCGLLDVMGFTGIVGEATKVIGMFAGGANGLAQRITDGQGRQLFEYGKDAIQKAIDKVFDPLRTLFNSKPKGSPNHLPKPNLFGIGQDPMIRN